MRVVVAGSSGFLGRHLTRALAARGDEVVTLVRRPPRGPAEHAWDPSAGVLPIAALDGVDAVINLCGAGVGDRRWSKSRRALLRSSRLAPTTLLAGGCGRAGVPVLLSASAVGLYGDRGEAIVTEESDPGSGFLARLCVDWEAAAHEAPDGVRVTSLRTGLVLGPDGGTLPRLARLTRFGLGGRLGSGRQWWPWISVADHVAATIFLLDHAVPGPVNLTAPQPVTNAEFTRALGRALRRPTPWVIPGIALRAVLGGFAGEILGGQRALPAALEQAGFRFLHPSLERALEVYAR